MLQQGGEHWEQGGLGLPTRRGGEHDRVPPVEHGIYSLFLHGTEAAPTEPIYDRTLEPRVKSGESAHASATRERSTNS